MNKKTFARFAFISFVSVFFGINCTSVRSQVIPDATLGAESSVVTPDVVINGLPSDQINGGAIRGSNLFHSFQKFNVGEGRGTYFISPAGIQNILTRVTGSNPSNIFGKLGVLGNANLFLINPNGIIFGSNASLDLNGSFLASTANSIKLSDSTQFSATAPQSVPLLKVSVPIGLVFTTDIPKPINVKGTGHNLFLAGPFLGAPILGSGETLTGLRTMPGKTIALVGGNVNFDGGIVTAPSGRIEISSVNFGIVSINANPAGFILGYDTVQTFQDIQFEKQALLDASGFFYGDISLRGRNVSLTDGSTILISNFGNSSLGKISVNATEGFRINGITSFNTSNNSERILARGLSSQNFSMGKGADILINAKNFIAQNSGTVGSETVRDGSGGNINITVGNSTKIIGETSGGSPTASRVSSSNLV